MQFKERNNNIVGFNNNIMHWVHLANDETVNKILI